MTGSTLVREPRHIAPSWRARPQTDPELQGWVTTIGVSLARAYLTFLGTLTMVALLPVVSSWNGYVVRSGSMEPSIRVGDVVIAAPLAADTEIPLGRVMVFEDQSRPEADPRILIHRVIAVNDDGTYLTAGDANRRWDSAALPRAAVLDQARLRVPLVGLPVVWLSRSLYVQFLAFVAVTVIALAITWRDVGRRRPPPRDDQAADPAPTPRRHRAGVAAQAVTLCSIALAFGLVGTASAGFRAESVNPGNAWVVSARMLLPYKTNVLANAPRTYYETEEASGSNAADSSGNGRTGTYGGTITYRQAGALTRLPGHSVLLGSNGRLIAGTTTISNPRTFSLELWFKTTTTSGGKLMGFESTRNQSSGTYDRHVFMRNDGKLTWGGWSNGGTTMITTPLAYNNGAWHHMVVTARPIVGSSLLSSNLYIDGARVATGNTTTVSNYSGYWRAGYGNLPSVTGTPSSATFEGNIDNFAVYTTELSASLVEIHYASR